MEEEPTMLVRRQITEEIISPWFDICDEMRAQHRRRRFAMKTQQKIDRALESFIRLNMGDWNDSLPRWSPDLPEKDRKAINAAVRTMVKTARNGSGPPELIIMVEKVDASREPWDQMRAEVERATAALAKKLPVAGWVKSIPGAGLPGLAIIVGEAGPLDEYPNPAKLRKRLGFAPYDGCAGSTWKREKWRPRALTKDEWIANPFSGERYAQIYTVADALFRKQWIGKKEDEETGEILEEGKPNGVYGEVYLSARKHVADTHPDWTKGHSHKHARRVMMQKYLDELWGEWMKSARRNSRDTN